MPEPNIKYLTNGDDRFEVIMLESLNVLQFAKRNNPG